MTPHDLVRKYEALLHLRATLSTPLSPAHRHQLRVLAREFPSALRELDTFSTEALQTRRNEAASATPPAWVAWMCRYHTLMREELERRRTGDRERATSGRLQHRVFTQLATEFEVAIETIWEAVLPLGRPRAYRSR